MIEISLCNNYSTTAGLTSFSPSHLPSVAEKQTSNEVLQTFPIQAAVRLCRSRLRRLGQHLRRSQLCWSLKSFHWETTALKIHACFLSSCSCLLWDFPEILFFFFLGWLTAELCLPHFTAPVQSRAAWGFGNNYLNLPPLVVPDHRPLSVPPETDREQSCASSCCCYLLPHSCFHCEAGWTQACFSSLPSGSL